MDVYLQNDLKEEEEKNDEAYKQRSILSFFKPRIRKKEEVLESTSQKKAVSTSEQNENQGDSPKPSSKEDKRRRANKQKGNEVDEDSPQKDNGTFIFIESKDKEDDIKSRPRSRSNSKVILSELSDSPDSEKLVKKRKVKKKIKSQMEDVESLKREKFKGSSDLLTGEEVADKDDNTCVLTSKSKLSKTPDDPSCNDMGSVDRMPAKESRLLLRRKSKKILSELFDSSEFEISVKKRKAKKKKKVKPKENAAEGGENSKRSDLVNEENVADKDCIYIPNNSANVITSAIKISQTSDRPSCMDIDSIDPVEGVCTDKIERACHIDQGKHVEDASLNNLGNIAADTASAIILKEKNSNLPLKTEDIVYNGQIGCHSSEQCTEDISPSDDHAATIDTAVDESANENILVCVPNLSNGTDVSVKADTSKKEISSIAQCDLITHEDKDSSNCITTTFSTINCPDISEKKENSLQGNDQIEVPLLMLMSKSVSLDEKIYISIDHNTPKKEERMSELSIHDPYRKNTYRAIIPAQESPLKSDQEKASPTKVKNCSKIFTKTSFAAKFSQQQSPGTEKIILQSSKLSPLPAVSHILQITAVEEEWYKKVSIEKQKISGLKLRSNYEGGVIQQCRTGSCRSLLNLNEIISSEADRPSYYMKTFNESLQSLCIFHSDSSVVKILNNYMNCQLHVLKQCVAKAEQPKTNIKNIWEKDEKIKPFIAIHSSPEKQPPPKEDAKNDIRSLFGKSKKRSKKEYDIKKSGEETRKTGEIGEEELHKNQVGIREEDVTKKKRKGKKKNKTTGIVPDEDKILASNARNYIKEECTSSGIEASFEKVSKRSKKIVKISEEEKHNLDSSVVEIRRADANITVGKRSISCIEASFKKAPKTSAQHAKKFLNRTKKLEEDFDAGAKEDDKEVVIGSPDVGMTDESAEDCSERRRSSRRKKSVKCYDDNQIEVEIVGSVGNSETILAVEQTEGKPDTNKKETSKKKKAKKSKKSQQDFEEALSSESRNKPQSRSKKSRKKVNKDKFNVVDSSEQNNETIDLCSSGDIVPEDIFDLSKKKPKKGRKRGKKKDCTEKEDMNDDGDVGMGDFKEEKKDVNSSVDIRTMFGRKNSSKIKDERISESVNEKREVLEIISSPENAIAKVDDCTKEMNQSDAVDSKRESKSDIRLLFKTQNRAASQGCEGEEDFNEAGPQIEKTEQRVDSNMKICEEDISLTIKSEDGSISETRIDEDIANADNQGVKNLEEDDSLHPISNDVVALPLPKPQLDDSSEELREMEFDFKRKQKDQAVFTLEKDNIADCKSQKRSIMSFFKPSGAKKNQTTLVSVEDSFKDTADDCATRMNDSTTETLEGINEEHNQIDTAEISKSTYSKYEQENAEVFNSENSKIIDSIRAEVSESVNADPVLNLMDSSIIPGSSQNYKNEPKFNLKRKRRSNSVSGYSSDVQFSIQDIMKDNPPLSQLIRQSKRKKLDEGSQSESAGFSEQDDSKSGELDESDIAGKDVSVKENEQFTKRNQLLTSRDEDVSACDVAQVNNSKIMKQGISDVPCDSSQTLDIAATKNELSSKRVTRRRLKGKQCAVEKVGQGGDFEHDSDENDEVMQFHGRTICGSLTPEKGTVCDELEQEPDKAEVNDSKSRLADLLPESCSEKIQLGASDVENLEESHEISPVIALVDQEIAMENNSLTTSKLPCPLSNTSIMKDKADEVIDNGGKALGFDITDIAMVCTDEGSTSNLEETDKLSILERTTEGSNFGHNAAALKCSVRQSLQEAKGKIDEEKSQSVFIMKDDLNEGLTCGNDKNDRETNDLQGSKRKRSKSLVSVTENAESINEPMRRRSSRVKQKEDKAKEMQEKEKNDTLDSVSPEKKRRKKSGANDKTSEESATKAKESATEAKESSTKASSTGDSTRDNVGSKGKFPVANLIQEETVTELSADKKQLRNSKMKEPQPMSCKKIVEVEPVTEEVVNTYLQWTEKYSPIKHSSMIGNEAAVGQLFGWLSSWKEKHEEFVKMMAINSTKRPKCGRKKSGMDSDSDFESSSEEEESLSNTFLIVGRTGCGSTAAVYACAQELGYKVLELNPSIYRTGKQIQSLLGEATQSHQVKRKFYNTAPDDASDTLDDLKGVKNLSSFFGGKSCKSEKQETLGKADGGSKDGDKMKAGSSRVADDMSVILLEQADVVFEDLDKGFWFGVNELRSQTKRPIVITANDSNIAFQLDNKQAEMVTMTRATKKEALLHLQIMCLAEYVLPSIELVDRVFTAANGDIRQSVLQLQFWLDHWKKPMSKVLAPDWKKSHKLICEQSSETDVGCVGIGNEYIIQKGWSSFSDKGGIISKSAIHKENSEGNEFKTGCKDATIKGAGTCYVDVVNDLRKSTAVSSQSGISESGDSRGSRPTEIIDDLVISTVDQKADRGNKLDANFNDKKDFGKGSEKLRSITVEAEGDVKNLGQDCRKLGLGTEDDIDHLEVCNSRSSSILVESGHLKISTGSEGDETSMDIGDVEKKDQEKGNYDEMKRENVPLIRVVGLQDLRMVEKKQCCINISELDLEKLFNWSLNTASSHYVPMKKQKKKRTKMYDGVISDLENIAASTEYLSFINMHDTSKRIAKETRWPHFELKDGLADSLPFDLEHQGPPFLEDWFSETYEISKEINKIAFKNLGLEGSGLVQDQTKNENEVCDLFISSENCLPLAYRVDHRAVTMDVFPALKSICLSEETRKMSQFKRRTRRFLHYLDGILFHVDDELKEEFLKKHLV